MASSTWSTACCCRADGHDRRVGAASAHTPASMSRGPPRKRGGPSLGRSWCRVARLAVGSPVGRPAVGSQVPPIQVEVAPGRPAPIGRGLAIATPLSFHRVTFGHVRPGHGDQAVRDLIVGGYQGQSQANVGLSTEVLGIRHRAGTPAYPLQRNTVGTVPDKQLPRRSFFLSGGLPLGTVRHTASPASAGGRAGLGGAPEPLNGRCPWPPRTPGEPRAAARSNAGMPADGPSAGGTCRIP
jgi:hypothetical protein